MGEAGWRVRAAGWRVRPSVESSQRGDVSRGFWKNELLAINSNSVW